MVDRQMIQLSLTGPEMALVTSCVRLMAASLNGARPVGLMTLLAVDHGLLTTTPDVLVTLGSKVAAWAQSLSEEEFIKVASGK
jgi:hypothetical protein